MSLKITFIGTGYVGLVSGACMAEIGHNVTCVDKNATIIESLEQGDIPIYEPGLAEMVQENVDGGRLKFSTELDLKDVDAVFLAVGTPTDPKTENADLSSLFAAAKEVRDNLQGETLIITKSTVPAGTGAKLKEIFGGSARIASNPEFLREGSAIGDFMKPDRVVCGVNSEEARKTLEAIYAPLDAKMVFMGIETAELTKYAANALLATKVVFINEMADLCEKAGANVEELAYGIGLDERIGTRFLKAGPGMGGSCFPKDTRALAAQARDAGVPTQVIEALIESNEQRKVNMAKKILSHVGEGTIAVFGLTFKANTDDMRESPAIDIINELQANGIKIRAYDPQGMEEAKKILKDVEYFDSAQQAAQNADAVVIITEWQEFKNINYSELQLKGKIIIDLRNILVADAIPEGFEYISVGR